MSKTIAYTYPAPNSTEINRVDLNMELVDDETSLYKVTQKSLDSSKLKRELSNTLFKYENREPDLRNVNEYSDNSGGVFVKQSLPRGGRHRSSKSSKKQSARRRRSSKARKSSKSRKARATRRK